MRDETASVVAPVTSQPRADSSIDGNSHVTRAVCMVQNFPDNTDPNAMDIYYSRSVNVWH